MKKFAYFLLIVFVFSMCTSKNKNNIVFTSQSALDSTNIIHDNIRTSCIWDEPSIDLGEKDSLLIPTDTAKLTKDVTKKLIVDSVVSDTRLQIYECTSLVDTIVRVYKFATDLDTIKYDVNSFLLFITDSVRTDTIILSRETLNNVWVKNNEYYRNVNPYFRNNDVSALFIWLNKFVKDTIEIRGSWGYDDTDIVGFYVYHRINNVNFITIEEDEYEDE